MTVELKTLCILDVYRNTCFSMRSQNHAEDGTSEGHDVGWHVCLLHAAYLYLLRNKQCAWIDASDRSIMHTCKRSTVNMD